jgi:hypothetical protein
MPQHITLNITPTETEGQGTCQKPSYDNGELVKPGQCPFFPPSRARVRRGCPKDNAAAALASERDFRKTQGGFLFICCSIANFDKDEKDEITGEGGLRGS